MSEDDEKKPLNNITPDSILDRIAKERLEKNQREFLLKEEVEEYTMVVNSLFASEHGKYFLNKLIRYCGINSFDNELNPAKLIEDAGKRKVYLEIIRPFLDVTILAELDN